MAASYGYDDLTLNPESLSDAIVRMLKESREKGTAIESSAAQSGVPSNLIESWESYWLQVALPGVDPETLHVEAVSREVTLHGTYRIPYIESGTLVRRGILADEVHQMFQMPEEVDGDRAEAFFERGILTVRLPKVAYLKPSSITVQTIA